MKTFFCINLEYKVPLEIVAQHVGAHRTYLDLGYQNNLLICSGPKIPKTGGMILAYGTESQITEFVKNDPFIVNQIADYTLLPFEAVKFNTLINPII